MAFQITATTPGRIEFAAPDGHTYEATHQGPGTYNVSRKRGPGFLRLQTVTVNAAGPAAGLPWRIFAQLGTVAS